jgi:hypothetical protein
MGKKTAMSGEIGPDTVYQVSCGFSDMYQVLPAEGKTCETLNL